MVLASLLAVGLTLAAVDADRRAGVLAHELMSPFCPQLLLADCRSDAAVALRGEIRDALANGTSESAVRAALVTRFGERILAAPAAQGFGLVAWLTPPVLLLLAIVLLARRLRAAPGRALIVAPSPADTPARRERLREELWES